LKENSRTNQRKNKTTEIERRHLVEKYQEKFEYFKPDVIIVSTKVGQSTDNHNQGLFQGL